MDPMELRLKNAAKQARKPPAGRPGRCGNIETMTAAIEHPHYSAPLGENQGRGVACFLVQFRWRDKRRRRPVGRRHIMVTRLPDVGGSRASLCNMAAEVLGCDIDSVKAIIADAARSPSTGIPVAAASPLPPASS